jgi:hypothetical protein
MHDSLQLQQREMTAVAAIDTSRICLSAHKTIEAGNENRLFTMDYIARLDFKLLLCVHSSKFGKCLLHETFDYSDMHA